MRPPRYLELDLPERIQLQVQEIDGSWSTFAAVKRGDFERQADGSFVCSNGGALIFLRVVEVHDDHFVHVDGAGDRFAYRLAPVGPNLVNSDGGPDMKPPARGAP